MSQTERLTWIDGRIRGSGGVTTRGIAERFEVSERQAKRDIEYLRDRLDAPIEFDRSKMEYRYRGAFDGLEFADEMAFLDMAFVRALVEQSAYLPLFSSSFKSCLTERSGPYASISGRVRYELPDAEKPRGAVTRAICGSMRKGTLIELSYTDGKGRESRRRALPLRLVNYGGKWYCAAKVFGGGGGSGGLRTFALARITEVAQTDEKSAAPPEAEIESFLSSSYGIFKGKPIGTATLRFSGGAARAVRNQVWHKAQTLRELGAEPAPIIELSLPVHDWKELLGRALRCGAQCEVVDPPGFRAEWEAEIAAMALLIPKKA
jgi:predicted DNA-binding transcriptional regulator YafY